MRRDEARKRLRDADQRLTSSRQADGSPPASTAQHTSRLVADDLRAMTNRTHKLVGVAGGLVVAQATSADLYEHAGLILTAYASSPWPDVDRWIPGIGHRTVTHYAITALAVAMMVGFAALVIAGRTAGAIVAAGVAIGYGGHIAADACTATGVPALAPFHRRLVWLVPAGLRIHMRPIRTRRGIAFVADRRERLFARLLVLAVVVYLALRYGG